MFPNVGFVGAGSAGVGNAIQEILQADDIIPGDDVSYQLCKSLFIYHPLANKMAESPVRLAQSQERDISVPDSPEEEVIEQFNKSWEDLEFSRLILNTVTQGRIYGIASIGVLDGDDPDKPLDLWKLWQRELKFNVFDPLNTAGSLVTSQDPNSPLFQKWGDISVAGQRYNKSRTQTFMNEESLYIAWTTSAYGYVGRSVYQRALYPMKSFLQSMITDDMVTRKAGLIVARMDQAGSIIDRVMQNMWGIKRNLLREGQTNNVISIGKDELIESINLRNVNDSMTTSRNNIIKNIATAADMPAKLLTQESFVEGFGEGTQDAYAVAQYIDRLRIEMRPIYRWADTICRYHAWNPEFYATIQRRYPEEYGNVSYEAAFYRWTASFRASWPSLIKEPPSEAVGVEDVKLKAVMAYVQVLAPMLDPENRARLVQWAIDQINVNETMFGGAQLIFDPGDLADYMAEQAEQQEQMKQQMGGGNLEEEENTEKPPKPFSAQDATAVVSMIQKRLGAATTGARA